MPLRRRADAGTPFGVDAVGRKVLEHPAIGSEDPDRGVLRADNLRGDLRDAREDPFQGDLSDHFRAGNLKSLEALLYRMSVGDYWRGHIRKIGRRERAGNCMNLRCLFTLSSRKTGYSPPQVDQTPSHGDSMKGLALATLVTALGVGIFTVPRLAAAQRESPLPIESRMHPDSSTAPLQEPPGGMYKKVSTLVPLPDFIPGLGTLYVDPATLPAGPFLAYDHQGHLVGSVYMIPLRDMNAKKAFSGLKIARAPADHVDIVYNAGHPGVAEPHYHIVVWYVSAQRAAELAKEE